MADPISIALFAAKGVSTAVKVRKAYQTYKDEKDDKAREASDGTTGYVVPTDNESAERGNGLYPSGLVLEDQDFVVISAFNKGPHHWSQDKVPGRTFRLQQCDFINTWAKNNGREGEFWWNGSVGTYDIVTKKTTYFRDAFSNVFTLPIHNPRTINWSFFVGQRNRLVVATTEIRGGYKYRKVVVPCGALKIARCESTTSWKIENSETTLGQLEIAVVDLYDKRWHPYIRKAVLRVYPSLTEGDLDTIFQS
ncbi:hypothetical protein BKA66DRAFT_579051 [Pyrenochaeta sp. MPI-SDFR-AT-0127]|nr:hypothetical protein BKA66DRAFT_579051 [Pyrenochaeta sp. MPI-SDFR-AT-0127]